MKRLLSNIWFFVGSALALLLSLFLFEKKKKDEAESKLAHAEFDKNDAVLKDRVEQDKTKLEEEKKKTLTADELAEFFKKNK